MNQLTDIDPDLTYIFGYMSGKVIKRLFKAPAKNSYFLFGARGTGKSTLLNSLYGVESKPRKDTLYINLLDPSVEEILTTQFLPIAFLSLTLKANFITASHKSEVTYVYD